MSTHFSISDQPIVPDALKRRLEDAACGACVTFEGWVRNHHQGREVLRLEYEAYEPVAVKEGEKILAEAVEKFGVSHIHCIHRVGPLDLGGIAVWVGVSAGHRGEAFDACRYVIDEVKARVPIWKKEFFEDGDTGWVNCEDVAVPRQA